MQCHTSPPLHIPPVAKPNRQKPAEIFPGEVCDENPAENFCIWSETNTASQKNFWDPWLNCQIMLIRFAVSTVYCTLFLVRIDRIAVVFSLFCRQDMLHHDHADLNCFCYTLVHVTSLKCSENLWTSLWLLWNAAISWCIVMSGVRFAHTGCSNKKQSLRKILYP